MDEAFMALCGWASLLHYFGDIRSLSMLCYSQQFMTHLRLPVVGATLVSKKCPATLELTLRFCREPALSA